MSSASTGGTEGSSPASSPASATSLAMAAPKYGTLVPNRIFVGGISASTSEAELAQVFSAYGNVKATKIISDRAGVSKGYGFVTFETEEEAKRLQQESECIIVRERKLNIAPAIKKQPFSRSFDGGSGSPPAVPTSTYYYTNGMSLTYQNGMTFYNTATPAPGTAIAPPPTDPSAIYQATGVFGPQATASHQTFAPVMYPCPAPSIYMPQQYQYSPMPYEPYYTGASTAGAQYMFTTGNSQNTTSGSGNGSGTSNNGTGVTSPSTGPPQQLPSLPPPPPTHFYAPAAAHHHHHPPPVNAGPPASQMDHVYYSFATGPPPPPPHAQIGLGDQQLLLYTTDPSCQPQSIENQTNQQEDSRSTSSHSEQQQSETQAAQPTGSSTSLVPVMPIKVPISGRYTNYHPLAVHSSNIHNSQTCINETDDTTGNQMHCGAFVYHPTVYIPHTSPYHSSNNTSLLPTPPPPQLSNQQTYDYNNQKQNYRDYPKNIVNPQNNYVTQNSNFLIHQNNFSKSHNPGNPQLYNKYNTDLHKYQSLGIPSSRISGHYKRYGSNAGSSSCFLSQKPAGSSYSNQRTTGLTKSNFDYSNNRRNYDYNQDNKYQIRKNTTSTRPEKINIETEKNQNDLNRALNTTKETGNMEKSTSPPPAPYSPMTRPLPTLSPPTSQVQFYNPAQNRFQTPIQQQQQQQQRRYAPGQARRTSDKYNSNNQNSSSILRQSKYKMNGIVTSNNKITDDSIGGAGDAPSRMPITPPATPRNSSSGEQNQLNDSCHQMAALTL
ncbi:deleted in azoospermia protein 1-like isoform X2 [Leptopilina boulardi]|uniref:deleted in azoospermia protein 1-like isoform X2 n=1 Tax=Leptopilina boulardi TaxID=63433 RepID=UPI0021F5CC2D|nr:deleted in azoospermia protein 1-like isoform X2 [Leptopilina boulardi]